MTDLKGKRQSKNIDDQRGGQSASSIARSYLDQQAAGVKNDMSRVFDSNSGSLADVSRKALGQFTKSPNFVSRKEDNAHSNSAFHANLRKGVPTS